MHCCKKISIFFALASVCLVAFAQESSIVVKNADLEVEGEAYLLNADLEIQLDDDLEEAINKGVLVEFLYEFELVSPRSFWFDQKVVSASTSINVSYHALSRQYLVNQGDRQTSHEILSEAMIEFVQLYDWQVFNQSLIKDGETYIATLNVALDQSKLPKAIQVEAISSADWNVVSEPFEWTLKNLKK